MTVVAALKDGAVVLVGWDSAATNTDTHGLTRRADAKSFLLRVPVVDDRGVETQVHLRVGFCHDYHVGQTLAFHFKPPAWDLAKAPTAAEYIHKALLSKLRKFLVDWGIAKDDDDEGGVSWMRNAQLLLVLDGEIFVVYDDLQVEQPLLNFAAIGSGADAAKGALYATQGSSLASWQRLDAALAAAEEFTSSVRGPMTTVAQFKS